jgi:hypothetical protein
MRIQVDLSRSDASDLDSEDWVVEVMIVTEYACALWV